MNELLRQQASQMSFDLMNRIAPIQCGAAIITLPPEASTIMRELADHVTRTLNKHQNELADPDVDRVVGLVLMPVRDELINVVADGISAGKNIDQLASMARVRELCHQAAGLMMYRREHLMVNFAFIMWQMFVRSYVDFDLVMSVARTGDKVADTKGLGDLTALIDTDQIERDQQRVNSMWRVCVADFMRAVKATANKE
jgi:hypothetical protein